MGFVKSVVGESIFQDRKVCRGEILKHSVHSVCIDIQEQRLITAEGIDIDLEQRRDHQS